jgi:iron complex transport system substrate-binding protein
MALIFLIGCSERDNPVLSGSGEADPSCSDSAAVVFGPSLTELFCVSGAGERLAAVDRYSIWPPDISELPRAGDFLSPSLEMIVSLGATSIHVVGSNQSLIDLAQRLGIPCYSYSFDRLDDVFQSCRKIEKLYPEADLTSFQQGIVSTMDSLSVLFREAPVRVMIVVYLEGDGAITLAGMDTFYRDIIEGIGCEMAASLSGSYPSVSVEGIMSIAPERVIILDPYGTGETVLNSWRSNGLDDSNVAVLAGDQVLIPGARLADTIRDIARCLN